MNPLLSNVELLGEIPRTKFAHEFGTLEFLWNMKGQNICRAVAFLFLIGQLILPVHAQMYAGILGGISTLSGDSRSLLSPGSTSFSSYDPGNGGIAQVFVGEHLSDYFSVQGNYTWNSNRLNLTSANFSGGTQTGDEERRGSSQQSVVGDLLVYFRGRDSWLRPYLSVGTGFVHFSSSRERIEQIVGSPTLPPQQFSANVVVLHVPVGMDVKLGKGWAFRYTFSETISKNPIDDRLSPPGQARLKNFQNLFGFIRRF
jgi:hypothetical protein